MVLRLEGLNPLGLPPQLRPALISALASSVPAANASAIALLGVQQGAAPPLVQPIPASERGEAWRLCVHVCAVCVRVPVCLPALSPVHKIARTPEASQTCLYQDLSPPHRSQSPAQAVLGIAEEVQRRELRELDQSGANVQVELWPGGGCFVRPLNQAWLSAMSPGHCCSWPLFPSPVWRLPSSLW